MAKLSLELRALLAVTLCFTIFGVSFPFSKLLFTYAQQSVGLANRFLVSTLLFSLLALTPRFRPRLRGKPLGWLLLLGVCEPITYFYFESLGIRLTNASFSSVMIALIPIFTLPAGVIFLGEHPSRRQVLFALLSISGVILVSLVGWNSGQVNLAGVLALLAAIISAVAFNLLARWLSAQFSTFERTYSISIIGLVFFSCQALAENGGQFRALIAPWSDPRFILPVLFLGGASSVVAYACYGYAIALLPVARVAIFANLTTVVSVLTGVIFLHEPFTLLQFLGCLVILIGLWGVNVHVHPHVHPPAQPEPEPEPEPR